MKNKNINISSDSIAGDTLPIPKTRKKIDMKKFVENAKWLREHEGDISFFDMSDKDKKEILDEAADDANKAQRELVAGDKKCSCHCHFGGDIEACNKAKGHPIRECKHCSKDPVSPDPIGVSGTEELEERMLAEFFAYSWTTKGNRVLHSETDIEKYEKMKSFIKSERAKAKEEAYKEILKMIDKMKTIIQKDAQLYKNQDKLNDYTIRVNQLLFVSKHISKLKEESNG